VWINAYTILGRTLEIKEPLGRNAPLWKEKMEGKNFS
jgi:hypothetical protein